MPVTATVQNIEAQALLLSPEERAQLADRLLASVSVNPELDDAWSAESLRRLAELEAGTVDAVPIKDAIARAREAIK